MIDTLIVGGGSCGSVLAARLSADPGRSVVLLEAGPGYRSAAGMPPGLARVSTLPIGAESDLVWRYDATFATFATARAGAMPAARAGAMPAARAGAMPAARAGAMPAAGTGISTARAGVIARGRVLGGSGAVNGGYFMRARTEDFAVWPQSLWSAAHTLPFFRKLESDSDFDGERHGADGPMPVTREPRGRWSPITESFFDACLRAGFAEELDKNANTLAGIGAVPLNTRDGLRVNAALAYVIPALGRANLEVRAGTSVRRLLFAGTRVRGVEADCDGVPQVIEAREVVVCAGSVASPQLLMLSGVGPAEQLGAYGIAVIANLPGVGSGFSDHPEIAVPYRLTERPHRPTPALQVTLNTGSGLEIRPYATSFADLIPSSALGDPYLGVALMRPESRGEIRLRSADPRVAPQLDYRYLRSEVDRRLARDGVRLALELLIATGVAGALDWPTAGISDDWLLAHLGTSLHLSGSARMGADTDEFAVVDERCRVRGVDGLRLVDTSVFPAVPSRGPHATAVMLAERVAALMS